MSNVPVAGSQAGKQLTPEQKIKSNIQKKLNLQMAQMGDALKHITPERSFMLVMHSMRKNPLLMQCSVESICTSVLAIALQGLECGVSNEAYLVPFKDNKTGKYEAIPIIGYQGEIKNIYRFKLDKNTPLVKRVQPFEVKEHDTFEMYGGSDARIEHKISPKSGDTTGYYAIAELFTGGTVFYYMNKDDMVKYATKYSKSKKSGTSELLGPWKTEFDAMAKKTVVHQLKKILPSSYEDKQYDTDVIDGNRVVFENSEIIPIIPELEEDAPVEIPEEVRGTKAAKETKAKDKKNKKEDAEDIEKKAAAEGGVFDADGTWVPGGGKDEFQGIDAEEIKQDEPENDGFGDFFG